MLFKVIIACVALGSFKAEPLTMEPQFEADDEDDARKKLGPWLESTGYQQAEGTEVEIVEVEPTAAPGAEPKQPRRRRASTASGPMSTDGVQLPTLDEYVAAGYPADRYDAFIAARTKKPEPEAKVEPVVEAGKLVIGESKSAWGGVYMGHDADGNEVWDPPMPTAAATDGETQAQQ